MGVLSEEARAVQNPAIGATLMAAATRAYTDGSGVNTGMPVPLSFLILPIVFHAATRQLVTGTMRKSGLRYFADKFGQSKNAQTDLLLAIQHRAVAWRGLTFESLDMMLHSGLAVLDHRQAQLFATDKLERVLANVISEKELYDDSGKLGYWFSQLSPFELSTTLKVAF